MRVALCLLLTAALLLALVLPNAGQTLPAGDAPGIPGEGDSPRRAAWWGLLCPRFFGPSSGEDTVRFTWPLLDWLFARLRMA